MSEERAAISESEMKYQKWYYWWRCPLLPIIRIRAEDKYNRWSFSFHWLVFRAWDAMPPHLGFEIKLDDSDFQIRLNLPYLYTGIFIPFLPIRFHQKLWRTK